MSRRQGFATLAAGLGCIFAALILWWAALPPPAGQTVTTINAAAAGALVSSTPVVPGASGRTHQSASTGGVVNAADPPPSVSVTSSEPESSETVSGTASETVSGTASETVSGTASETASDAAPSSAAFSIAPASTETAPVPTPVRIEVPAVGVDSSVVPVGVDADGKLEVPDDVRDIGWYRFGPAPGAATGSAVLTGHVDDRRQGRGAFAELGNLQPGDLITVVDENGAARIFSVLAREEWRKSEVPLDRLFDRTGSPRLVLITCGGSFNSGVRSYTDNIAVTAVPVG